MLYIILIIIAVGVLLASEAGQALLGLIIGGGAVTILIGIVIILLVSFGDNLAPLIGPLLLVFGVIYGINLISKKHRQGELSKQKIKARISRFFESIFVGLIAISVLLLLFIPSFLLIDSLGGSGDAVIARNSMLEAIIFILELPLSVWVTVRWRERVITRKSAAEKRS